MAVKYDFSEIRPYDIIFTSEKATLLDKAIWWFSVKLGRSMLSAKFKKAKRTTHVLLALSSTEMIEMGPAGFWRGKMPNYNPKRVNLFAGRIIVPFDARIIEQSIEKYSKMKYDYSRLLIMVLCSIFRIGGVGDFTKNAMICSELVTTIFRDAHIDLVPGTDACNVTPFDLIQSPLLDIISMPQVIE